MRYRLPPFIRLRPRPNFGYEAASGEAMLGNHKPTNLVFRQMLVSFLEQEKMKLPVCFLPIGKNPLTLPW